MRLGLIVRQERLRRGWSAQHLADLAGVSQPAITRFENGERIGRVDTVMKITSALGIDPSIVEQSMRGEDVQSPPIPSEMSVVALLRTALAQLELQRGETLPGEVVMVPFVEGLFSGSLEAPQDQGEPKGEVLPYLPRPEEIGDRFTAVHVKIDDHAPRIRAGDDIVINWNPTRAHEGDFVVVQADGHRLLRVADASLLEDQPKEDEPTVLGVVVYAGRRP